MNNSGADYSLFPNVSENTKTGVQSLWLNSCFLLILFWMAYHFFIFFCSSASVSAASGTLRVQSGTAKSGAIQIRWCCSLLSNSPFIPFRLLRVLLRCILQSPKSRGCYSIVFRVTTWCFLNSYMSLLLQFTHGNKYLHPFLAYRTMWLLFQTSECSVTHILTLDLQLYQ